MYKTMRGISVDEETFNILSKIAASSGTTPEGLLKKLTERYRQANLIERSLVLNFLR
jgi:hypothetical protein